MESDGIIDEPLIESHQRACSYLVDGHNEEAINLLGDVVTTYQMTLTEDDPNLLASQHNLSFAYQAIGHIEKTMELLEQVVTIREKVLNKDHPDLLVSQHQLACTYLMTRRDEEAV